MGCGAVSSSETSPPPCRLPPNTMGSTAPLGLRRAVRLADFTTWKVGGPAQWFAEPDSIALLLELLSWAQAEGLESRIIGAGSNLLISDQGLPGLTLCNRRLQGAQLDHNSGVIDANAGEPIPTLARRAARAGLAGLEGLGPAGLRS